MHELHQNLKRNTRDLTGLTIEQAMLLCELDLSGGAATVSDLASTLGRSPHSVTARADGLVRKDLVSRRHEESPDRRRVWVVMTEAGAEKLDAFRAGSATLVESLTASGLDGETLGELRRAMQDVRQALSG